MDYLDLLMRVSHILGACILVGAMVFMLLALVPAMGRLAEDRRREFFNAMRPAWAMLVGLGTALLLVSGLYNTAMTSIRYTLPGEYHALLGVKIVLALIVFFLAALVSGRTSLAQRLQEKLSLWLTIAIVLLMLTMAIGSHMKVVDRDEKPPQAANSGQTAASHPTMG